MTTWILNNSHAKIEGQVELGGAKNSILKLMAASLLSPETTLDNIDLSMQDLSAKIKMLEFLGTKITQLDTYRWKLANHNLHTASLKKFTGGSVRTSILLIGSLIHHFKEVVVPFPGGCKLGERPFDLHVDLFEKFGLHVELDDKNGFMTVVKPMPTIKGITHTFQKISTGATENGILLGVLAQGETILYNAHTRPEVLDLCNFLTQMGAKIKIPCNGVIQIQGPFTPSKVSYRAIHDNMEAITYAIYCGLAAPDSILEIKNFPVQDLIVPIEMLKSSGMRFYYGENSVIVKNAGILGNFHISTGPYPGINSDMQPLFAALAHKAKGSSKIIDLRFQQRFAYTEEFSRLGSCCILDQNELTIPGEQFSIHGGECHASDLRAGAALVGLSLLSNNPVTLKQVEQVLRGYSQFQDKLTKIGFNITTKF